MLSCWPNTSSHPLVFWPILPPRTTPLISARHKSSRNSLLPEVKFVLNCHFHFPLSLRQYRPKWTHPSPSKYPRTKSPKYFRGIFGKRSVLLLFWCSPYFDKSANMTLLPIWRRCLGFQFSFLDF